jgi:lipoprotein-anchoring transpeptidase ErfK/SrfK
MSALAVAAVGAALVSAAPAQTLSNESTFTRWAHPVALGAVRAAPRPRSRTIAHLRLQTEDRLPEVYLVLERRAGWLRIRIPGRPNGRTGWVPADKLGALRTVHTQLTIDRRTLRAVLRRNGRAIWRSPIGVGKPGTETPAGRFWIRERLRNLGGSPLYGPWAFATSAYSNALTDWPGGGVIGVHGTDAPQLIPGRPSHGCVRVPNDRIRTLATLMPIGTPVLIR